MKKLLILLNCFFSITASYGQSVLGGGQRIYPTPLDQPYIMFDILRSEHPFILRQYNFQATQKDWINVHKYITEAELFPYFTKLQEFSWDVSKWENENSHEYVISRDGISGKISMITVLKKDGNERVEFFYNISGMIGNLVYKKEKTPGVEDYEIQSTRFIEYNGEKKMIFDSLSIASAIGSPWVTRYSYVDSTVMAVTCIEKPVCDTIRVAHGVFDSKGNLLEFTELEYEANHPSLNSGRKYFYTYDMHSRVLTYEKHRIIYPGGNLVGMDKVVHGYNGNDMLSSWIKYRDTANTWAEEHRFNMFRDQVTETDTGAILYPSSSPIQNNYIERVLFMEPIVGNVAKIETGSISVFPNPVDNMLYLDFKQTVSIRILDLSGRIVFSGRVNERLDVSFLQSGIYFLVPDNAKTISFAKM